MSALPPKATLNASRCASRRYYLLGSPLKVISRHFARDAARSVKAVTFPGAIMAQACGSGLRHRLSAAFSGDLLGRSRADAEVIQHENTDGRRKIVVDAIGIDPLDKGGSR